MKKTLLITSLFALLLMGADPVKLIRLTIINKSGVDLGLQLQGTLDDELYYYLTIQEGKKGSPTERTFTIAEDVYNTQIYYIETWDPVYGYKCDKPAPVRLVATRNLKVVFTDCNSAPPHPGEPSMMKYWPRSGPFFWFNYWGCRYIY